MTTQYKKLSTFRYMLILIGMCGITAANVGLITNVAGLFYTPIMEDFGVLKGAIAMTLTISAIISAISGMFTGKIIKKYPVKLVLIIGFIVTVGSTVLLTLSPNLFIMYVLNAIRGFAAGIVSLVLVTTVMNNWFIKNSALFASIAMGFSGLASAVFSSSITSMINSHNWQAGYLYIAVLMVILALPSILFLPCVDPHEKGILAYGEESYTPKQTTFAAKEVKKTNPTLLILACLFAFLTCAIVSLPQHFPGIAENYGFSAALGTTMLSICMIMNTGGKVLFGALADKIGSKKTILLFTAVVTAAVVGLLVLRVQFGLVVSGSLYGCGYAIVAVGCVVLTRDLFGIEGYGKAYPIISLVGVMSNAIFNTVVGYIYDFTGGYTVTLLMMIAFVVCLFFVVILSYKEYDKQNA